MLFVYKTILSGFLILNFFETPSAIFHHKKKFSKNFHKTIIKPSHFSDTFTKVFNIHHNHHSHHWSHFWNNEAQDHSGQIKNDEDNTPKIDIRWDFGEDDGEKNENKVGLDGCKFGNEDFNDFDQFNKNNLCKSQENSLIVKELEQGWCFGFYSSRRTVLTFSLDRGYRIQYSPGNLQIERTNNFNLKLTFQSNTIYSIILRGTSQGVPNIKHLRTNGENVCETDEEPSTETSVTPLTTNTASVTEVTTVQSVPDWHSFNIRPSRWNEQYRQICGKRRIKHSQLISNGMAARPDDWPWHAAIYHATGTSFKYKCGGTLISHSALLSAGHCMLENGNQVIPERVKVQLGKNDLFVSDPNSRDVLVRRED